ncbi:small EDRK-rich factor 2-like [Capsicum chacoense]
MFFKFMVFFPFCGFVYLCCLDRIIRGNQREKDRERAQARSGGKAKKNDDGLTPEQRRERDAKALQEKAAKKAAKDAAGGTNAGSKSTKK